MDNTIGIIGGSGLYDLLPGKGVTVSTPYGRPSGQLIISTYKGKKVVFLPRHGTKHQYPPQTINYLANMFALKKMGVQRVLAPCAVGSLTDRLKPGQFVIADQLIDRTKTRRDTYFNGPKVKHISLAEPYCPELRELASASSRRLSLPGHDRGTVLVIEGPRFATRAESQANAQIADLVNMTQYPETALARELELCYVNISIVTDYDAGVPGRTDVAAVTAKAIAEVFQSSLINVRSLLLDMIDHLPKHANCRCRHALADAAL